jgi:hypothetical protein
MTKQQLIEKLDQALAMADELHSELDKLDNALISQEKEAA